MASSDATPAIFARQARTGAFFLCVLRALCDSVLRFLSLAPKPFNTENTEDAEKAEKIRGNVVRHQHHAGGGLPCWALAPRPSSDSRCNLVGI
jgi:hypothetical protein